MLKKFFVAGLLAYLLLAVFPAGAASVSFLVMETGLPMESPINQYSTLWENCLLEVFFESGHIVSNAPRLRLAEKPSDGFPDEAEKDVTGARDGGMDYFLIAVMDYQGRQKANVVLRLFTVKTQTLIGEQEYGRKTFMTVREEYEDIKKAIRVISARLD